MLRTSCVVLSPLVTAFFGLSLACGEDPSASTTSPAAATQTQPAPGAKDVVATVNGRPITEADIRLATRSGGHGRDIPPEHRKNVLEAIIQQELIYQRAAELGLDATPTYQERLHEMEAQINAFKRKVLADLFFRQEIAAKASVSEAEARTYFEENAPRIRTEYHVWQILMRREDLIEQALKDIKQGTRFEDVAGRRFPKLPKTSRPPWDLGYLKWKQVPKEWQSALNDLKKGDVSGVIRGPGSRFWIIKLIDKRENLAITFENIQPAIMDVLKGAKTQARREQIERDLRAKASIVYMKNAND